MDPTDQASERFIAAAVRPLADNAEMQMMAGRELRHLLASRRPSANHDALLKDAATSLETAPSRVPWKTWLYALCAVVSILVAIPVIRDYQRLRLASWGLFAMTDPFALALPGPSFGQTVNADVEKLIGDFSPQQELLLFGSRTEGGSVRFRALWDLDPENVAYFSQHFLTSIDGYDPSPPDPKDLLEAADRLDPGNAWFRYIAAAVYSKILLGKADSNLMEARRKHLPIQSRTRPRSRMRSA